MHTRTGRLRAGWVAGVLAFGTATASAATASTATALEPVLPWAEGEAGQVEESPSGGRLRYVWPAVRDEYVRDASLKEIAMWVQRQRRKEAWELARARGWTGDVIAIWNRGPAPLNLAQWDALMGRAAHDLSLGNPDLEADARQMLVLLTGMPEPEEGPLAGHRAAAEETLRQCASDEGDDWRGLPYLTADLAARTGDTGFMRRVMLLIRQAPSQKTRARLAEAIAASEEHEHDPSKDELTTLGGELFNLASEPGLEARQRIAFASVAMRLADRATSLQLIDRAIASEHADIRRAGFNTAIHMVRQARADGDPEPEVALTARLERFMAGMNDTDERISSSAVSLVHILLEGDPNTVGVALVAALDSTNLVVATAACLYLLELPDQARTAIPTIRKLTASRDGELRYTAIKLLNAIGAVD